MDAGNGPGQFVENLQKNADKFSRVFHLSPDAINLNRLDDGTYVEINEGFERMTGWTRAEVLGRSSLPGGLRIWARALDRERLVAALRDHGEVQGFEAEFRRKDGTLILGLMSARILEVDGESCVLSITRDITERKRAEDKIESQNALLNAVIDSTEEPIFSLDRNYCYTLFNAGHARWMKEQHGKEIGVGVNVFDYLPEGPGLSLIRQYVDCTLQGRHVEFELPSGIEQVTNRLFWMSLNPVFAANGDVTGVAVFGRDLTEHRRLQEQLLQAQKMEAIGQLAGGIAHDFRNQLTIITGFCELLLESGDVLPRGKSLLQDILKAAHQSTDLTGKLLGFSRKQLLRPKLVDVAALTAEACQILPRLLREDVKLTCLSETGAYWAMLDPVQLQQAIYNLATNARDAMPQGGALRVSCEICLPDTEFRLRHPTATAPRYVAVTLADTGHGMDEKTLEHIFEPFFTTKPCGHGTGLGLAMVYGFVNQCAGIIDVQSKLGVGSTFTLYFPEVHGDIAVPAPSTAKPMDLSGRERILVIEDQEAVRRVVVLYLKSAGYDPVEAADASAALQLLNDLSRALDLLLTDMVMPELSGMELANRARVLRPNLPVLLMSGYTNAQMLERGLKETGGHFLEKPFSREVLLRAVRRAIDSPMAL